MKQAFDFTAVDKIIDEIGAQPSSIIAILQGIQEKYRYLPHEVFPYMAERLGAVSYTHLDVYKRQLQLLPLYLNYLKSLPVNAPSNTSATIIADALGFNDVQVRKDLASVSDGGKPKIGYITADLIAYIEDALGYNDTHSAVIVGVGNLGHALMAFEGFNECGLDIVAEMCIRDRGLS